MIDVVFLIAFTVETKNARNLLAPLLVDGKEGPGHTMTTQDKPGLAFYGVKNSA
jgi:hypothetical protein